MNDLQAPEKRQTPGRLRNCFTPKALALSGVVAALYAAMCLLIPVISYGGSFGVDIRISEAMTLLPALIPECAPGLVVGCFLANIYTGNIYDMIFGTLATLIAAVLTVVLPKKLWLKALPPVICNGIIVGLVLTYGYHIPLLWYNMASVAAGEAIVVFLLGIPLVKGLEKARVRDLLHLDSRQIGG